MFESHHCPFLCVQSVFWLIDSTNHPVLEIFRLAQKLRLDIVPVHLCRENYRIQLADYDPRFNDPYYWTGYVKVGSNKTRTKYM